MDKINIDYGKLFYRIENVITYLLILFYLFFLLAFYIIRISKNGTVFDPIFVFIVSFIRPVASLIWVTFLFLYVSILIVLSFSFETKADYLKIKELIDKKRFARKIRIKHKILDRKKIISIPFYETFFLPRFRENPVLNTVYMFYPTVYIIALIYLIVSIIAFTVEYWEGRIIEIMSLIYFFLFRVLSRIISLLILSKLETGKFRDFTKFKEYILKVKIRNKTKLFYILTKE